MKLKEKIDKFKVLFKNTLKFLGPATFIWFTLGIIVDKCDGRKNTALVEETTSKIQSKIIELDEKIIKYWNEYDIIKTKELINEKYDVIIDPNDEEDKVMGYVVASYYNQEMYKDAAIQVLERDKHRAAWDWSLKCDLAQCIRSYTLQQEQINGLKLIEGVKLVNELKKKYGDKISSVFWTCLPFDFIKEVEDGIYGGGKINIRDSYSTFSKKLNYLKNNYPNDKFIDHAYLALGDYDYIINNIPESRIKNIAILSKAYTLYRNLLANYKSFLKKENINSFDESLRNGSKLNSKFLKEYSLTILECIDTFESFNKISTTQRMSDDALLKIGLLHSYLGNYESAIICYLKTKNIGNGDVYNNALDKVNYIIKIHSDNLNDLLRFDDLIKSNTSIKDVDLYYNDLIKTSPVNYLKIIQNRKLPQYDFQNIINLTTLKTIEIDGNLNQFLLIKNKYQNLFTNQRVIEINEILDKAFLDETTYNSILKLRNNRNCRKFCHQLIERIKSKNDKSNILPNLLYTQIAICQRESDLYPKADTIIHTFLNTYKNHQLADDVLAELIFREVYKGEMEKAMNDLRYFDKIYPNGNARDNAYNWVAKGLLMKYYKTSDLKYLVLSKQYYEQIIKEYSLINSRFPNFAKQSLEKIKLEYEKLEIKHN